mmetsp:Transcript_11292/g.16699  ORF Transcript_11292/g.16699 Transcript_11292/m.16699 type:complete len:249 (+) Transcript_11292:1350-2096(+)
MDASKLCFASSKRLPKRSQRDTKSPFAYVQRIARVLFQSLSSLLSTKSINELLIDFTMAMTGFPCVAKYRSCVASYNSWDPFLAKMSASANMEHLKHKSTALLQFAVITHSLNRSVISGDVNASGTFACSDARSTSFSSAARFATSSLSNPSIANRRSFLLSLSTSSDMSVQMVLFSSAIFSCMYSKWFSDLSAVNKLLALSGKVLSDLTRCMFILLACPSLLSMDTKSPPNPKMAPTGLDSHFGAVS